MRPMLRITSLLFGARASPRLCASLAQVFRLEKICGPEELAVGTARRGTTSDRSSLVLSERCDGPVTPGRTPCLRQL